ncbi:MAG TPA: hypothetical protein VGR85_05855 [Candidatus Limnocylindria bacterium]|jgi:hypothetical protein|nr:hypothetical protein [Candidatus Limnocylindria bacterium]
MRPAPQPTLIPAEFCAECVLRDGCAERDSVYARGRSASVGRTVDLRDPFTLDQWLSWADHAFEPVRAAPTITLPRYFVTAPRGVPASAIRSLTSEVIGFTLGDFGVHARAAERGRRAFHAHVGTDHRRVIVLGADPDRAGIRAWQRWPRARGLIERHRPDLVVGSDLSFYENDEPATRMTTFFAHTRMYADLVNRGIAAMPPFGWVFPSDIDRFVAWVADARVPGAFLDLQNRTGDASFGEVLRDLRGFRGRLPADFTWIVKGVQVVARWRALTEVLGTVTFTSSGPWEEARNRKVFEPYTLMPYATTDEPEVAFAESVHAFEITAAALGARPRLRALPQQLTMRLPAEPRRKPARS